MKYTYSVNIISCDMLFENKFVAGNWPCPCWASQFFNVDSYVRKLSHNKKLNRSQTTDNSYTFGYLSLTKHRIQHGLCCYTPETDTECYCITLN